MNTKVTLEIENNKLTLTGFTDEKPDKNNRYINLDHRAVELVEITSILFENDPEFRKTITKSVKEFSDKYRKELAKKWKLE